MKENKRIFIQRKIRAYILPGIYGVAQTYTYSMTLVLKGKNFGSTLVPMENGVVGWYVLEHKLKEVADKALTLVKKDPDYVLKIRKKFEDLVCDFVAFTTGIFHQDLKKISNRQLWLIMDKYFKLYPRIYAWGEPITLGLEDSLGTYLKEYLKKITSNHDLKSLTEIYNILISPKEKSFVKREEDDLLEIVRRIQKDEKIRKFFIQGKFTSKELSRKFPEIYDGIRKHKDNYCWVPYDYGVYLWDLKYFLKVIKDLAGSRNAEKDLKESRRYYQTLANNQQQLIKKFKIDAYHQKLFKALQTATFLLDHKKEQFTKSHYQIMPVLKETARRFKINEVQVRIQTPNELKQALLYNKQVSQKRLKSRQVVLCDHPHP